MRNLLRLTLPLAMVLVASLVAAGAPTPLAKWMKPNVADAKDNEDFVTLQKSLRLVADKPPPIADYPKWVAIAKAGADAAGKKNLDGVKASCRDCHNAYKAKYKKEQASRPFP